jgi:hypothetical protein
VVDDVRSPLSPFLSGVGLLCGVISWVWIALGVYTNFLMQLFLLSLGIHALCLLNAILNELFELFPDLHGTYVAKAFVE